MTAASNTPPITNLAAIGEFDFLRTRKDKDPFNWSNDLMNTIKQTRGKQ